MTQRRLYTKRTDARQFGSAYLEFLFVAPIILLLAGSTIEFARFMRFRLLADSVSKEVALEAYRNCDITKLSFSGTGALQVNQLSTTPAIQTCIRTVATLANDGLQRAIPGGNSVILLSMFRFDYANPVPSASCSSTNPTRLAVRVSVDPLNPTRTQTVESVALLDPAAATADSAFSISSSRGISFQPAATSNQRTEIITNALGCQTGRAVVAEIPFRYTPIINWGVIGAGGSFRTNFRQTTLNNTNGAFRDAFRESAIF